MNLKNVLCVIHFNNDYFKSIPIINESTVSKSKYVA